MTSPISYNIFLASPGDVQDERVLARAVTEQIRAERAFRDRLDLKCIGWDQPGVEVAMEANLTPQEAIKRGLPKPSECDLVVVILWSRMGTPLPPEYKKPDGTGYLSGTEWEYQDAIGAAKRFGRPTVWLYRRTQVPDLNLEDPKFDEKRGQWQKVKDFFEPLVGEGGSLKGGVNAYQTPDEFRRQFEQHLRDRLTAHLEEYTRDGRKESPPQEVETKDLIQWKEAPYPGLEAFKPEQAPIFFGRGPEIDQLLEILRNSANRFVAVVGASGSGKSSLVAAGLIPRLRAGALPGSDRWIDITFRPGERGGDPFLALAYAFKTCLGATGQRETELAADLRANQNCFASCVGKLLSGRSQAAELLLVVDQFEEMFTLVDGNLKERFIEFIGTASRTEKVRVIATMRADFTANVAEAPALAELFRSPGIFLLSAPGLLALADMIRRPAQLAGLELKNDLCEKILEDTGTGSGALALMAFTLHEVYERGKIAGKLTLDDYKSLGGVAGAIDAQAERALQAIGQIDDRLLHTVFSHLVEVNDQGVATRRHAYLKDIRKDLPKERVVDALVGARILVAGEHADNPTIEVAHEAVFSGWRRLSKWVESHAAELRTCRRLTRAALEWQEAGAPLFDYLPDRATLKQYRKVRPACSLGNDTEVVGRFLNAGRRRQRVFAGLLALVLIVLSVMGTEIWLRSRMMNWNVLYIWTLAKLKLYDGPPMVEIRGDKFQRGSSECATVSPENRKYEGCPQKWVTVRTFWIGKYEVTFDEYSAFAFDNDLTLPLDEGWGRGSRPVINVSWEQAKAYADWLKRVTRKTFRLPTEAEWEYACRAGTQTTYYTGDKEEDLDRAGWYGKNSGGQTHPKGEKEPNAWGLYDMHGNVWEWVEDDWHDSYEGAPDDGSAWVGKQRGSARVIRGGSWDGGARFCRSATRAHIRPGDRGSDVGFRLSRSVALGP